MGLLQASKFRELCVQGPALEGITSLPSKKGKYVLKYPTAWRSSIQVRWVGEAFLFC
jgi:hypothetical protein